MAGNQLALLLTGLLAATPVTALAADDPLAADDLLAGDIAAIERKAGGRVGVALWVPGSGVVFGVREHERFVLASTFKALLAAVVLAEVDRGELQLETPLPIPLDVVSHSPVTKNHAGATLSVRALAGAIVTHSDNTAANVLLETVGGPAGLTARLRQAGDDVTRLDRYEPALNANEPHDLRDTTTPAAMARALGTWTLGDALGPAHRERLIQWLRASRTGHDRLRAGLPRGWHVGDKTGTGARGAVNDVAVVHAPGCPPFVLAVYLSGSASTVAELANTHRAIAERLLRSPLLRDCRRDDAAAG